MLEGGPCALCGATTKWCCEEHGVFAFVCTDCYHKAEVPGLEERSISALIFLLAQDQV